MDGSNDDERERLDDDVSVDKFAEKLIFERFSSETKES